MMKILIVATLLLASGSFGHTQESKAWDGFVTDTHCGTNCQRTSAMTPDRGCIRLCVKRGSKYGLWYGNHVYVLEPRSEASKFAGDKVHVVGNISNEVIKIQSIMPIPAAASPEKQ
jgi:hypothetical protein